MALALTLALAVCSLVAVVALSLFLIGCVRYHLYLRKRGREGHGKPLHMTSLCALLVALILNAGAFCYSACDIYDVLKTQPDEGGETAQNDKTSNEPATGDSGPAETAPATESSHEPTGPVRSVEELFPEYFHLSDVQNSSMLLLFEEISTDGTITASGLAACGLELRNYLERCAYPQVFYPFYEGLEPLFPQGDAESAFEDVSTYEESMAQIRGAGAALEACSDSTDLKKIYDSCYHLAIRSKDALYFGTKNKIINARMTWVLGELAYAALINESVYGALSGPDLSDWYYRMAQIFEYVGDIADTKALKQQLYYVATVCYYCAYEQISGRGLAQAGGSYGGDIWDAYFGMVFKVTVWMDTSLRKDFFMIILEGEMDVEASGLSDAVVQKTQDKLGDLDTYSAWKKSPEGIEAAQDLAARREEGNESA